MKRSWRLRRPEQFQRVRSQGRTYNHPLIRLNVAPNRRHQTRCGFVVGKRIGNAVQRNRARRRLREAVRLLFPDIKPGMDLVFVVRNQDVIHVPFTSLMDSVETLLKRANVWNTTHTQE